MKDLFVRLKITAIGEVALSSKNFLTCISNVFLKRFADFEDTEFLTDWLA